MSHVSEALALLPDGMRQPKLQALLTAMAARVENAGVASDALLAQLQKPTDSWLDWRADLVGVNRADTWDDASFARKITASAAARVSSGTVPDLLRVLNSLHPDNLALLLPWAHLTVECVIPGVQSALARRLTRGVLLTATDVRVLVTTSDLAASDEFTFSNSTWLPTAVTPGMVTVNTRLNAASGMVIIAPGLATEETAAYIAVANGIEFECVGSHDAGTEVVFDSVGSGFGGGGLIRTEESIVMGTRAHADAATLTLTVASTATIGSVAGITADGTATLTLTATSTATIANYSSIDEGAITDAIYFGVDEQLITIGIYTSEDEGSLI